MTTNKLIQKIADGIKDLPDHMQELQRKTPGQYDYGHTNQLEALIHEMQKATRKLIETRVYMITSKNMSR